MARRHPSREELMEVLAILAQDAARAALFRLGRPSADSSSSASETYACPAVPIDPGLVERMVQAGVLRVTMTGYELGETVTVRHEDGCRTLRICCSDGSAVEVQERPPDWPV